MSRKNFIKLVWRGEKLEDILYEIIENVYLIGSFDMPFSYDISIFENVVSVVTYATDYHCEISDEEIKEKYGNRVGKRSSDFVRSIPACTFEKNFLDEFDGIYTNTTWKTKFNFDSIHPDKVLNEVMHILHSLDITDKFVFYLDCIGNISISYYM